MVSALQTVKFNSVPIDPTTDHNGQYERQRARSEKQSGKEPRQQQFEFEGGQRSPMTAKASTLVGQVTNHHHGTKPALDERVEGQRRQKATLERIQVLLTHLSRYGIPEAYLFDVEDLMEHKNIPKVTRCIAVMAKMVSSPCRPGLNYIYRT